MDAHHFSGGRFTIKVDCEIDGTIEWDADYSSLEETEEGLSSFINNTPLFDVDFRVWDDISEKEYRIEWTAKIVER